MISIFKKNKALLKDNAVLFISTTVLNLFGFLFHFYMGRTLGPSMYGVLGVLLSLIYITNIPLNTIQTSLANFVIKFNSKKDNGKINFLLRRSLRKLSFVGIGCIALFLLFIPLISSFLHISRSPLYILSLFILFLLLTSIVRGFLQGLQKFKFLGGTLIGEGIIKFSLGVLFVSIGWSVNGAVLAIIFSYVAAFAIGIVPLKRYVKKTDVSFDTKQVYSYSLPLILMLTALTLFYTLDLILVKHFFSEENAGFYAALSLIGKVLFFGSLSISQVMFPKVTELYTNKEPTRPLLHRSLGILSLFIIPALIIYFTFSRFIVNLFYGEGYFVIAPLVGWYGLFIGIFSYSYLISFYNISLNKRKFIALLFLFVFLETVLISFFHESLSQIVYMLVILSSALLIALLTQISKK